MSTEPTLSANMDGPALPTEWPRIRTVAVHWPRLLLATVVVTVVLGWAATAPALAVVWDSVPASLAVAFAAMFAILGVGRPYAEFACLPEGIERREALFHRWLWLPGRLIRWDNVGEHGLRDELDGTESLVIRGTDGNHFRIWAAYSSGMTLERFYAAFLARLAGTTQHPDPLPRRSVPQRALWLQAAAIVLAVGWIAIVVASLRDPPAAGGVRIVALGLQGAILIAPLLRVFRPRYRA